MSTVVLSGAEDPLGRRVAAALGQLGRVDRVVTLDRSDLLGPDLKTRIEGAETVGVTSGASVPESLVQGVLDRLASCGFEDVETVTAAEESLIFSLPKELRRDLKTAASDG